MATAIRAFGSFYQKSYDSKPNATLAVTGGCLQGLGDGVAQISQQLFRKEHQPRQPYDFERTARFVAFGICISSFIGKWNNLLERQFPLRAAGSSPTCKVSFIALGKRVAADQVLMAPLGIAVFIGAMGIMERRDKAQISQKYHDMLPTAVLVNWKIWPAAQLINFRYMPLPYRVPFSSTCGIFWTLYMSILNSKEDKMQGRKVSMQETLEKPADQQRQHQLKNQPLTGRQQ